MNLTTASRSNNGVAGTGVATCISSLTGVDVSVSVGFITGGETLMGVLSNGCSP